MNQAHNDAVISVDRIQAFDPATAQTHQIRVAGGLATLQHDRTLAHLGYLHVEASLRGRGIGQRLLHRVHAWADATRRDLYLLASQAAPDGPDSAELEAWYGRQGWTVVTRERGVAAIMARERRSP